MVPIRAGDEIAGKRVIIYYPNWGCYAGHKNFQVGVMTYDFHVGTAKISNHHSALYRNPNDPGSPEYNVDFVMKYFKDSLGIPAAMLNIGVPYYSHGWKGVKPESGSN